MFSLFTSRYRSAGVGAPLPAGPVHETNTSPASILKSPVSQPAPGSPVAAENSAVFTAPPASPAYIVNAGQFETAPTTPTTATSTHAPSPAPAPATAPAPAPVLAAVPVLAPAPAKRVRRGGAKHHVQLKSCRSELLEILRDIDNVQTSISSSFVAGKQPAPELVTQLQALELRKAANLAKSDAVLNGYAAASKAAEQRRLRQVTHAAAKIAAKPVATPAAETPSRTPAKTAPGPELDFSPPRSWASYSPESTSTVEIFTSPRPAIPALVTGFPPSVTPAPAKRAVQPPMWAEVPLKKSSAIQIRAPGSGPVSCPAPSYASQNHSGAYMASGYPSREAYETARVVHSNPLAAPQLGWPTDVIPRPPPQSFNTPQTDFTYLRQPHAAPQPGWSTETIHTSYRKPHAAPQPGWSTDNFTKATYNVSIRGPTSAHTTPKNTKAAIPGSPSKIHVTKTPSPVAANATTTAAGKPKGKSPTTAAAVLQPTKNNSEKKSPNAKSSPKAASAKPQTKSATPAKMTTPYNTSSDEASHAKDNSETAAKTGTTKPQTSQKATSAMKQAKGKKKKAVNSAATTSSPASTAKSVVAQALQAQAKAPKAPNTLKTRKASELQYFDSSIQGLYLPVHDDSSDFEFAPTGIELSSLFEAVSPSTTIRVNLTLPLLGPEVTSKPSADDLYKGESVVRICLPGNAKSEPVNDPKDAPTGTSPPSPAPSTNEFEDDCYQHSALRSGDLVMDCDPLDIDPDESYYMGSTSRDFILDFDSPAMDSDSKAIPSEATPKTGAAQIAIAAPEAPTSSVPANTVSVVAPAVPAAPVVPTDSTASTSSKKKSPCKLARAARRRENRKAAANAVAISDTLVPATKTSSQVLASSTSKVVEPVPTMALTTSLPESSASSPVIIPSKMSLSVPDIALTISLPESPISSSVVISCTLAEPVLGTGLAEAPLYVPISAPVPEEAITVFELNNSPPGSSKVSPATSLGTVPFPDFPTESGSPSPSGTIAEWPRKTLEESPKSSPGKVTGPMTTSPKSKSSKLALSSSRTFRVSNAGDQPSSATQGTQSSQARHGSSISRPASAASVRPLATRKASDSPSCTSMSRSSSASFIRAPTQGMSGSSSVANITPASSRTSRSSSISASRPSARSVSRTGSVSRAGSAASVRARSQSSASTTERVPGSKPELKRLAPVKPVTGPKSASVAQHTSSTSLPPLPRLKPVKPVTGPKYASATPSRTAVGPPPLPRPSPAKPVTSPKSASATPTAYALGLPPIPRIAPAKAVTDPKSPPTTEITSAATPSSSSAASTETGPRPGMRAIAKARGIFYPKAKPAIIVSSVTTMAGPMSSPITDARARMSPIPGSPALKSSGLPHTPTRSVNPYAMYGHRGYDEDYSYGRM